jgi:hypothetical protein
MFVISPLLPSDSLLLLMAVEVENAPTICRADAVRSIPNHSAAVNPTTMSPGASRWKPLCILVPLHHVSYKYVEQQSEDESRIHHTRAVRRRLTSGATARPMAAMARAALFIPLADQDPGLIPPSESELPNGPRLERGGPDPSQPSRSFSLCQRSFSLCQRSFSLCQDFSLAGEIHPVHIAMFAVTLTRHYNVAGHFGGGFPFFGCSCSSRLAPTHDLLCQHALPRKRAFSPRLAPTPTARWPRPPRTRTCNLPSKSRA